MIADGNRVLRAVRPRRTTVNGVDSHGNRQIAVRLSHSVFDELKAKAAAQNVSVGEIIRRMIERGLWTA